MLDDAAAWRSPPVACRPFPSLRSWATLSGSAPKLLPRLTFWIHVSPTRTIFCLCKVAIERSWLKPWSCLGESKADKSFIFSKPARRLYYLSLALAPLKANTCSRCGIGSASGVPKPTLKLNGTGPASPLPPLLGGKDWFLFIRDLTSILFNYLQYYCAIYKINILYNLSKLKN